MLLDTESDITMKFGFIQIWETYFIKVFTYKKKRKVNLFLLLSQTFDWTESKFVFNSCSESWMISPVILDITIVIVDISFGIMNYFFSVKPYA